jgi:type IV pilus assembly protein PilQ
VENGTIGEITATQYDDKGRIEIGLTQVANYNISKEDRNLIIDVEKVKKAAEAKEVRKEEEGVKERDEKLAGQPPAAEALSKAKEIVNFSWIPKKDFVEFNIFGDGKIENFNAFKLDSPARLVLDIWGVDTRYPQKSIKAKNPFVKGVRIGQHSDKLRLVFDSLKPQLPPYQINPIENKLIVSIGNVPQPSEPQILLPGKAAEVTKTAGKVQLKAPIDFKQMDHKSRIVVTLTGEPKYESTPLSKNTIAVDIKNAFAPKHLQRGLDTREFESAVEYISVQNVKVGKTNDIRISIKLREEVPFEMTKEGKVLFIDIEKPKKVEARKEVGAPPKKEEVPAEAKKEEIRKEEMKEEMKKEVEKPIPERPVTEPKVSEKKIPPAEEKPIPQPIVIKKAAEEGIGEKIYTGRKLSLDFKDADIKNILRLIAEVSNLNVIAAENVTGKITMRLVDVPWDQALDIVLTSKGLDKRQVGNVIWVAPRDALKKEDQEVLEARRAKEKLEDLRTELISVNYATAKDLIPQIKHVLSERGDIKVDDRTNIIIVKDIADRIASVNTMIKSLDTKTPQVVIEARIVEAGLTFQRELGIKWGFLFERESGQTAIGGGIPGSTLGRATREVVDFTALPRAGVPGAVATSAILEAVFSKGSLQQLDIAISAHENKGDVKIISSPKIATLDNKEASVEQGLRIPYPKLTTEGTVTTDFIDANLKLTVTPHVTNDGNVKMIVKAKKDRPDFAQSVLGVPSIDKKEAITEVLVKDTGVVVIAGIYTIEKTDAAEGVPLLNRIPLLGWFFKRETKEDTRKDLLIFISPRIAKDQI